MVLSRKIQGLSYGAPLLGLAKSISYTCTFAYVPSVDHLLSSPSKSGTSPFVSLILTSLLTASRVTALKLSIFSSSTLGRITLGAKA